MNKAFGISLMTIVCLGSVVNAKVYAEGQVQPKQPALNANAASSAPDAVPTYQTVIDGASTKEFLGNDIPIDLRWDPKKDDKRAKKLAQKQAKEQAKNKDGTTQTPPKKSGGVFGAVKAVGEGCVKAVEKTADFVGFPVGDDED